MLIIRRSDCPPPPKKESKCGKLETEKWTPPEYWTDGGSLIPNFPLPIFEIRYSLDTVPIWWCPIFRRCPIFPSLSNCSFGEGFGPVACPSLCSLCRVCSAPECCALTELLRPHLRFASVGSVVLTLALRSVSVGEEREKGRRGAAEAGGRKASPAEEGKRNGQRDAETSQCRRERCRTEGQKQRHRRN